MTLNIEPDVHMYSPSQQNGLLLYFSKEMSDSRSAWVIFLRFRNLRYFPLVYDTSMVVVVRIMSKGYENFCLIMSLLCFCICFCQRAAVSDHLGTVQRSDRRKSEGMLLSLSLCNLLMTKLEPQPTLRTITQHMDNTNH